MPALTLSDLLAKHGSLINIPEDALRKAGYERVVKEDASAGATSVQVRRIGAKPRQPPPAPRTAKDGRIVPNKDWGYQPGWAGRGKVRHHA